MLPDSGATIIPCPSRCLLCRMWRYVLWQSCPWISYLPPSLLGDAGSTYLLRCCGWYTRSTSCLRKTSQRHYPPCCPYPWGACSSMPTCLWTSSLLPPSSSSGPSFSWQPVSSPFYGLAVLFRHAPTFLFERVDFSRHGYNLLLFFGRLSPCVFLIQ